MKVLILSIIAILCVSGGLVLYHCSKEALKEINFIEFRDIPFKRDLKRMHLTEKHSAMLIKNINSDSESRSQSNSLEYRIIEEESTLELARKRVKR